MASVEQRAKVEQVDDATMRLLANELRLVKLASNKDKNLATLAAATLEIEACTSEIVRATEDLLVMSRGLKEEWVLGQRKQVARAQPESQQKTSETVDRLIRDLQTVEKKL